MTKVFTPLSSVALFYDKTSKKEEIHTEPVSIGSQDADDVNLDDICPIGAGEGGHHVDAAALAWLQP